MSHSDARNDRSSKLANMTEIKLHFLKKWANPGLFFRLFLVFSNMQYNFYNKCEKCPNLHPIYGAGIWTHNLTHTSHHP